MWSELLQHCPWLPPWEVFFYEGGPSHCPHYSKPITWSKLFLFYKLISNSVSVNPISSQPKMPKLFPRGDTRNPHNQASDKDWHTLLNTPSFHSHPHFRLYPHQALPQQSFLWVYVLGEGRWYILAIPALRRPKQDDLCESRVNLRHIHSTGNLKP